MAIVSKGNVGKANIIIERIFFNTHNRIGNVNVKQIVTTLKSRTLDVLQLTWKDHFTETSLTLECFCSNGRNNLTVDGVGDGNIATVSRIGTNLNGSVIQFHVCIWNPVILVYPVCIECQICRKYVCIPIVLLGTLRVVIPTVKHSIKTFGFGNVLKSVIADKNLFGIFQFVGHHIKFDRTMFLQN